MALQNFGWVGHKTAKTEVTSLSITNNELVSSKVTNIIMYQAYQSDIRGVFSVLSSIIFKKQLFYVNYGSLFCRAV